MQEIKVKELTPHPKNEYFFDDMQGEKWTEFLESVKTSGVIEPVIITQNKVIVSGHQRVRACKELGIESIWCEMRDYKDDDAVIKDLLETNMFRIKDINNAFKRIIIVNTLEIFYNKEKQKIKEIENKQVNQLRAEISQNKKSLIELHNNKCDICDFDCESILEIHHLLPLKQGGKNDYENLMVLCPNCHRIIHKYISFFKKENTSETQNAQIDLLDLWIENNYTKSSYDKIRESIKRYVHKKYRKKEIIK